MGTYQELYQISFIGDKNASIGNTIGEAVFTYQLPVNGYQLTVKGKK